MLTIEESSDDSSDSDCPTESVDVTEIAAVAHTDTCSPTRAEDPLAGDEEAASKTPTPNTVCAADAADAADTSWTRAETLFAPTAALPNKQRPRNEWDKLTTPWFTNAVDVAHCSTRLNRKDATRPRRHSPRAPSATKRERRNRLGAFAAASDPTATKIARSGIAPPSSQRQKTSGGGRREACTQRQWRGGDYCDAKYLAQEVGSALARWYPGRIVGVSDNGLRCDVLFDDGDYEASVPVRFIRVPRNPQRDAAISFEACVAPCGPNHPTESQSEGIQRDVQAARCLLQFACEPATGVHVPATPTAPRHECAGPGAFSM